MFDRFTEKARRTIFFARYEASQFGSPCIETEHLLLGILRESSALQKLLGSAEEIRNRIGQERPPQPPAATSGDLPLSRDCTLALSRGAEVAERAASRVITPQHLLLGLLKNPECLATRILKQHGIGEKEVRGLEVSPGLTRAPELNCQNCGLPFVCRRVLAEGGVLELYLKCEACEIERHWIIPLA